VIDLGVVEGTSKESKEEERLFLWPRISETGVTAKLQRAMTADVASRTSLI